VRYPVCGERIVYERDIIDYQLISSLEKMDRLPFQLDQ
jgi:hypothetical protein